MPSLLPRQRFERKVNFAGGWKVLRKFAGGAAIFCWLRNSVSPECCKQRSTSRCE